ncbi:uncharacterized protein V6R79_014711 [Siganus canaliculatus]
MSGRDEPLHFLFLSSTEARQTVEDQDSLQPLGFVFLRRHAVMQLVHMYKKEQPLIGRSLVERSCLKSRNSLGRFLFSVFLSFLRRFDRSHARRHRRWCQTGSVSE